MARYFVGSTIAFFFDLAVLSTLHAIARVDLLVSGAVAFCSGVGLHYVISVRWVFPERSMGDRRWLEFALYFAVGLTGLAVNELVLWGLAQRLAVHFLIAKGVSGLVVLAWTFALRRTLLFRRRRRITHDYGPPRPAARPIAADSA